MNAYLKKLINEVNPIVNPKMSTIEFPYYVVDLNDEKIVGGWNDPKNANEQIKEIQEWHPRSYFRVMSKDRLQIDFNDIKNWKKF